MNMSEGLVSAAYIKNRSGQAPPCGTVGCIAGWAVALSTKPSKTQGILCRVSKTFDVHIADEYGALIPWDELEPKAQHLLGIGWAGQANRLFQKHDWPQKWQLALDRTKPGTKAYAKVVCGYIDYYIKEQTQ